MADVPILRPDGNQQRMTAWPASLGAIPHRIDPNGLVGITPEGQALARSAYMDGEQLLAAIAGVVRHELRRSGSECAVPGCEGETEAALTLGLGAVGPDTLAVNVWLCAEHGEQADQAIGGAPELTAEQRAIVERFESRAGQ